MKLTTGEIAKMIDISAVQAAHGREEIRAMVDAAVCYGFGAVHVLPCWVAETAELLAGHPEITLGAPVGFPSGAHTTEIKVEEARQLISDGVREMDIMINVGKLRSGDYEYVKRDLKAIIDAAGGVPVKVIVEVHHLDKEQIARACDAAIESGAAYVKTATGWVGGGTTLETVRLITDHVGDKIKVKVSGGIRTVKTLLAFYQSGVRRFGINLYASKSIVDEVRALPEESVELR